MAIPIWSLDENAKPVAAHSGLHHRLSDTVEPVHRDGVYLVARTYHTWKVLELDAHIERMERSASLLGYSLRVPRSGVRAAVRSIAAAVSEQQQHQVDVRFRLSIQEYTPLRMVLAAEPAPEIPDIVREEGVSCCLLPGAQRQLPQAKTSRWIKDRPAPNAGCYEYLLVADDGRILEGTSSNFYAVIGGTLRTAASGVLEGIARRIILDVARHGTRQITTDLRAPTTIELRQGMIEEAFISSATRGLIGVSSIDGYGLSVRGPIWTALDAGYHTWLTDHLEELPE